MYTTVLFDLDGTLLPMDQDRFVKAYFGGLAKKAAPRGYDPETLVQTIWKGTAAMVKNDGAKTNEEVFWALFAAVYGEEKLCDKDIFDAFYANEFQGIQPVCGYTDKANAAVKALKECGVTVALATNPLFPAVATESRMRWAGLDKNDFALVTTYENSRHCKPNLAYYRDICTALGVAPEACLMVGNDVGEDMVAEALGMGVFLLTDCLINKENADISRYPHGDFAALTAFLAG